MKRNILLFTTVLCGALVSCQVKEAIYKKFRVSGIKVPHNIVDVHTE